jgi:hypothetical protein
MKCDRCNTIVTDESWTRVDPDNPVPSITTIEPYYLCNECAKELLMDSQQANEGNEI